MFEVYEVFNTLIRSHDSMQSPFQILSQKLLCNLKIAGAELAPDCFVDIQNRPYRTKYWTNRRIYV